MTSDSHGRRTVRAASGVCHAFAGNRSLTHPSSWALSVRPQQTGNESKPSPVVWTKPPKHSGRYPSERQLPGLNEPLPARWRLRSQHGSCTLAEVARLVPSGRSWRVKLGRLHQYWGPHGCSTPGRTRCAKPQPAEHAAERVERAVLVLVLVLVLVRVVPSIVYTTVPHPLCPIRQRVAHSLIIIIITIMLIIRIIIISLVLLLLLLS